MATLSIDTKMCHLPQDLAPSSNTIPVPNSAATNISETPSFDVRHSEGAAAVRAWTTEQQLGRLKEAVDSLPNEAYHINLTDEDVFVWSTGTANTFQNLIHRYYNGSPLPANQLHDVSITEALSMLKSIEYLPTAWRDHDAVRNQQAIIKHILKSSARRQLDNDFALLSLELDPRKRLQYAVFILSMLVGENCSVDAADAGENVQEQVSAHESKNIACSLFVVKEEAEKVRMIFYQPQDGEQKARLIEVDVSLDDHSSTIFRRAGLQFEAPLEAFLLLDRVLAL